MGGLRIKKKFPEKTLAVFVKTPTVEIMEARLRSRKTDSEEKIIERLAKADRELAMADKFDIILINDDLETAQQEAAEMVEQFIS